MKNTVGPRLKVYRLTLGLSQGEFGEKCGISQRTYANLENGRTSKISADYLTQIEAAFPDLSPSWLRHEAGPMLRDGRTLTLATKEQSGDDTPPRPGGGMRVTRSADEDSEAYWRVRYEGAAQRLADKERELERALDDLSWFRDAYRKPPASAIAADYPFAYDRTPISLRPTACRLEGRVIPMWPAAA